MPQRIRDLLQQLILPLRVGDRALEQFTLAGCVLETHAPRVVYTFTPGDIRIALEPRSARACFAQTQSFNILHLSQGPAHLSPGESRLLQHVAALIRGNDPGIVVWHDVPTLFLVPGTIGNRFDLSLRGLDILRRVPVVIVEAEKEAFTQELLTLHGVSLEGKSILPLPEAGPEVERLLADLVAREHDLCLFGADEGLPGFNDPGKLLLIAAEAFGARLRVRTVGGTSALAMTLLRVPLDLDRFIFLNIDDTQPTKAMEELVRQGNWSPLILFLRKDPDAVVRRMAAVSLPRQREVFVACNLTRDDETLIHLRCEDDVRSMPELDPSMQMVLVIGPPPQPPLTERR